MGAGPSITPPPALALGSCNADGTAPNWSGFHHYEVQSLQPLLWPCVCIFAALLLARLAVFRCVLPPIAAYALGPEEHEKKLHRRFNASAWRSCMYGFASVWVVSSLLLDETNKAWMSDSRLLWKGWPQQHSSDEVFSIYALYIAMYMHELVFVCIDPSGDDFIAMVAHHIVTIALLICSWLGGLTRVGGFIMSLHDVSDFLLMTAKCFNYAKLLHPRAETIADAIFVAFTVSFYGLRLGVYPSRLGLLREACEFTVCPRSFEACVKTPTWQGFGVLLGTLQFLQIFWGWKLAKAVYQKVVKGVLTDVREE